MENRWIVVALGCLLGFLLIVVLKPRSRASQALTAQRGPRTDTAAMTRGEMLVSAVQHLLAGILFLGGATFLSAREGWSTLDPQSLRTLDTLMALDANPVMAGVVLVLGALAAIMALASLVLLLSAVFRRRHRMPPGSSTPGARRPYGG